MKAIQYPAGKFMPKDCADLFPLGLPLGVIRDWASPAVEPCELGALATLVGGLLRVCAAAPFTGVPAMSPEVDDMLWRVCPLLLAVVCELALPLWRAVRCWCMGMALGGPGKAYCILALMPARMLSSEGLRSRGTYAWPPPPP